MGRCVTERQVEIGWAPGERHPERSRRGHRPLYESCAGIVCREVGPRRDGARPDRLFGDEAPRGCSQLQAVPVSIDLGDDGAAWGGAAWGGAVASPVHGADGGDGVELGVTCELCGFSVAADREGGDTRDSGDTNGHCGVPDGVGGFGGGCVAAGAT